MSAWLAFIVGIVVVLDFSNANQNVADETLLVKHLLKDYLPTSRPVIKFTDSVDVSISLAIQSIVEVNLKDEYIAVRGVLTVYWIDQFLTWNDTQYGGVTEIQLRPEQVWTPDIVLENGLYDDALSLPKPSVVIQSDGSAIYDAPVYYRAECDMHIRYYPFDNQKCELIFTSWAYTKDQLNLSHCELDLYIFQQSSAFELISEKIEAMVSHEPDLDGLLPASITLVLTRKTLHYLYTILWPSVIISLVSSFVFLLSPESGEKISLGITVMLVFQMLVWSVGEDLPQNGDQMPLLALYLSIIMLMTAVSVGMSILVINIHAKKSRLPEWVHLIFLDILAKIVRVKVKVDRERIEKHNQLQLLIDGLIDHNLEQPELNEPNEITQQQMLRLLQVQILKDRVVEWDGNEWKTVAKVIDRLLFCFFLFVVVGLAIGMLIVVPMISKNTYP